MARWNPKERAVSDKDGLSRSIAVNSSVIYVARCRLQIPGAELYIVKKELPRIMLQVGLFSSQEACWSQVQGHWLLLDGESSLSDNAAFSTCRHTARLTAMSLCQDVSQKGLV